MSNGFNMLTHLHWDVAELLDADEKMRHVQIIPQRPRSMGPGTGLFENRVNDWFKGQVPKNGKAGLAIVVFLPEGVPQNRANTGLAVDFEFVVRAVEEPAVNDKPGVGTGTPVEDLIVEVMLILQQWVPLRGHPLRIADFGPVDGEKEHSRLRMWECTVRTHDGQRARPKCSLPAIAAGGPHIVTLSCDTPDAALYYTTDGQLPTPAHGTLYAGPLEIPGPGYLRVMAWKDGHLPSDCASMDL